MAFIFHDINPEIRAFMLEEIRLDIGKNSLYLSKRFNDTGSRLYPDLLSKHVTDGDETTLTSDLQLTYCFKETEERKTKSGIYFVKVPITAAQTFAEGEFNRFYLRAICLKALKESKTIEIYRARFSENPRIESEMLINTTVDPQRLLEDLRNNIGVDTAFGLPQGPNSGLSGRIK